MKAPLGNTVLGDMLPRISETARLSRRYTNHCLRATSVGILKDSGFDDRAVCRLAGHKTLQSLGRYCRSSEKREASSRTCARRKNVQVAIHRGFFLFFESSGNDHFVQPTRQLRFQEQRHSQPHDQHQERRRRFLKKKSGLLSVSNGLLSVSNGHLTRNKSLLRFCVIKWEWKIST